MVDNVLPKPPRVSLGFLPSSTLHPGKGKVSPQLGVQASTYPLARHPFSSTMPCCMHLLLHPSGHCLHLLVSSITDAAYISLASAKGHCMHLPASFIRAAACMYLWESALGALMPVWHQAYWLAAHLINIHGHVSRSLVPATWVIFRVMCPCLLPFSGQLPRTSPITWLHVFFSCNLHAN